MMQTSKLNQKQEFDATLPQSLLLHLLPQAQRPHVCPHFLDVGQAFFLGAALTRIPPAESILAIGWPDRVLLLMIQDDFVDGLIFSLFRHDTFLRGN